MIEWNHNCNQKHLISISKGKLAAKSNRNVTQQCEIPEQRPRKFSVIVIIKAKSSMTKY